MGSSKTQTTESASAGEAEQEMREIVGDLLCNVFDKVGDRNPTNMWKEHVLIRSKLDRVSAIQESLGDTDRKISLKRGEHALQDFLEWSTRRGVQIDGVTVAEDIGMAGYKLQTTRPIQKGEQLVVVPRRAILSLDGARRSAHLKKLFAKDHMLSKMDNVALAIALCCLQIQEDNLWMPYLDILPSNFETPLYYSTEQMQELRPSPAYEDVLNHYRSVARQFCYYFSVIDENNRFDALKKEERVGRETPPLYGTPFSVANFTFSLYKWAVCCVTTRINQIPSEKDRDGNVVKQIPCLIPMLDFANHMFFDRFDMPPGFADSEDCAVLPASCDLAEGEDVNIQYGLRTTGDFLLHNAFSPDPNPYNKYRLRIGLPKTDKFFAERVANLKEIGFGGNSAIYVMDIIDGKSRGLPPFPEPLLHFARVFVANPPTEQNIASEETHKKAIDFLLGRFTLLMRSYEQKEEVKTGNVAILLKQEKEILSQAVAHCEQLKLGKC